MNSNFTIQMKKKTFFVYSPDKQVMSERYEFKSDLGTYTVKLSNYLKHVTKTFNLQKNTFDFQANYRDSNISFCL